MKPYEDDWIEKGEFEQGFDEELEGIKNLVEE